MSLHNFNPNNKSWKMYSNTITSISGDNLTIKPYDGKNLLLEVSGNNEIIFKRGDISYNLDDLIDTNITLTSVSGDIIPSNDNAFKLGDVSKNWSNAYIRDLSVSNISVSENFILNISGSMTNITDIFNNLGNTFDTIGTSIYNIEDNVIDLSNNKAPLANPTFTGTVVLPANTINSSHIATGSILGEDISNGTITEDKLSSAVQTKLNLAGTIPANSINSSHIINGSILTADISDNAITNAKIADFSITNSKLDDNSIDSRKIIAGSILGTDIAINQIGVSHLTGLAYLDLTTTQAPDSINSSHIVNGSITGSDIAGTTITGSNIANATIGQVKFDASFTAVITDLTKRIVYMESYARSPDIIIPNTTVATIPINFVDNDSITINAIIRCYGQQIGGRLTVYFRDFVTNTFTIFTSWQIQIINANNTIENYSDAGAQGLVMYDLATPDYWGQTHTLELRLYKPFNENLPDDREWSIDGDSVWHKAGIGRARASFAGVYNKRPQSIVIGSNTGAMTFETR